MQVELDGMLCDALFDGVLIYFKNRDDLINAGLLPSQIYTKVIKNQTVYTFNYWR